MSEKLPQDSQNEEVDLGQLFNAIGRLFEKLFSFVGGIFKAIFGSIIYALKPVVNNFKLVMIAIMTSAVIGFIAEKFNNPVYVSDMLVRPYFDSKYQLANNVNYFNALISARNHKELAEIFEIDSTTTAKELLGFELEIGPETQNDLLKEYDNYIKSIDSSLAEEVTYEGFIENRDVLSGSIFSIKALASSNNIFPALEKGFIKTLENDYSRKMKRIRDSSLIIRKVEFEKELKKIDSLQKIYIQIKLNEVDKNEYGIGPQSMFPLIQEKTVTKEFELFQEELRTRNNIRAIDEKLIEESEYYDILSSFENVGSQQSSIFKRYSLILPVIVLLLIIISYIALKVFKYIKEYE